LNSTPGATDKSFSVLFFKKELLPFLPALKGIDRLQPEVPFGTELSGQVAIVTGASRGIGAATAATLAAAGASVVLTGRNEAAGQAMRARIEADGGTAAFVAADQGSDADWARLIGLAEQHFGGVDILVLNAGVTGMVATADMTLETFRELNRINLKGAFLGVKHAASAMRRRQRGGAIAIVSSIVGKIGVNDHLHYAASKAGTRMLAKAAALELGPEQIRVNSIHPGMTRTEMIAHFPPELESLIPLGRYGEPHDVANAVLFLVSPRAAFMTGAEIVIDGGWTAQ
jgi:3alpha(or 20beta)-hydroxysteroid dehydrogenase